MLTARRTWAPGPPAGAACERDPRPAGECPWGSARPRSRPFSHLGEERPGTSKPAFFALLSGTGWGGEKRSRKRAGALGEAEGERSGASVPSQPVSKEAGAERFVVKM